MRIVQRPTVFSCLLAMGVLCFSLALICDLGIGAVESDQPPKPDCGLNSLYILLRLQGRLVEFSSLESSLPTPQAEGYSMAELASASAALGSSLEGRRYSRVDGPLDRPVIAYTREPEGGHFLVLRPVGTTGTMVQVIDPPHVPVIVDYDRVFASKSWTNRVLRPVDPWLSRHALPVCLLALSLVLVSLLARRTRKVIRAPGQASEVRVEPSRVADL